MATSGGEFSVWWAEFRSRPETLGSCRTTMSNIRLSIGEICRARRGPSNIVPHYLLVRTHSDSSAKSSGLPFPAHICESLRSTCSPSDSSFTGTRYLGTSSSVCKVRYFYMWVVLAEPVDSETKSVRYHETGLSRAGLSICFASVYSELLPKQGRLPYFMLHMKRKLWTVAI